MADTNLNGSVDLLAKAMRKVFVEAVQEGIRPLEKKFDGFEGRIGGIESRIDGLEGRMDGLEGRMDGLEGRMDKFDSRMEEMNTRIGNMESNVQAQLAQNRKDIANDVREALGKS